MSTGGFMRWIFNPGGDIDPALRYLEDLLEQGLPEYRLSEYD
jgi:hypothetical protein